MHIWKAKHRIRNAFGCFENAGRKQVRLLGPKPRTKHVPESPPQTPSPTEYQSEGRQLRWTLVLRGGALAHKRLIHRRFSILKWHGGSRCIYIGRDQLLKMLYGLAQGRNIAREEMSLSKVPIVCVRKGKIFPGRRPLTGSKKWLFSHQQRNRGTSPAIWSPKSVGCRACFWV